LRLPDVSSDANKDGGAAYRHAGDSNTTAITRVFLDLATSGRGSFRPGPRLQLHSRHLRSESSQCRFKEFADVAP